MQRGETGHGYVYYRDRSRGFDVTVYEHQLVSLLEHDPHRVFHPDTEIHHRDGSTRYNVPSNLEVLDRPDHCRVTHHSEASP
jgi:hypothetical protein